MEIKENQELVMENVLSFRGKVTQQQMQAEMEWACDNPNE